MGSRSFQNNLSAPGWGREVGAHEYFSARPPIRAAGKIWKEEPWANGGLLRSLPRTLTGLRNASDRKGGKARPPGCAESHRARTPTTSADPAAPHSRVRKWRGKDGSVPGRRVHHVQLPTDPSPPCGPPRPGLVAAWGKPRRLSTEGKASYSREPTPNTALKKGCPAHQKGTKATLKGPQNRKA